MRVRYYHDFAALPPRYEALFDGAKGTPFYLTRPWLACLASHGLTTAEHPCLIGVEEEDATQRPLALLAARHRERDDEAGGARTLSALSSYYTMVFAPQLAPDADGSAVLTTLFEALRARQPRYDMLRFQPLERDAPAFRALHEGLRAAGFVTQPYFHFGNWFEETEALDFDQYMAQRPSALRNLLKRRGRRLAELGRVRFEIVTGREAVERGRSHYEQVQAQSWKSPEPHPRFIGELVVLSARLGALRLGILHLEDEPIAAQIWILWNRRATIYKLVHDQRYDRASPGSLLTAHMMDWVLTHDRPMEVDFGAGDDAFKRDWLSRRRERWGIAAFDPRTPRGARGVAHHVVGRALKRAVVRSTT